MTETALGPALTGLANVAPDSDSDQSYDKESTGRGLRARMRGAQRDQGEMGKHRKL